MTTKYDNIDKMPGDRKRGKEIRQYILENAARQPTTVAQLTARQFGITRQAVNYHIKRLTKAKQLERSGATSKSAYFPVREPLLLESFKNVNLEEHEIWQSKISPHLRDLPANVREICHYGFTEIFNNAIDHSESETIQLSLERSLVDVLVAVSDRGEGIFKRICRLKRYKNEEEAIFELSKGKLTTDPERHTGEGIFFASRMFDWFTISSHGLAFSHQSHSSTDWLLNNNTVSAGTNVVMRISNNSEIDLEAIFDEFADPEKDPSFHKTIVPIDLAKFENDGFISRSQAKRVLNRVEKFKEVWLDFQGISKIGQAFADEIFRVFRNGHPDIKLVPINTNKKVADMIKRVENNNV